MLRTWAASFEPIKLCGDVSESPSVSKMHQELSVFIHYQRRIQPVDGIGSSSVSFSVPNLSTRFLKNS